MKWYYQNLEKEPGGRMLLDQSALQHRVVIGIENATWSASFDWIPCVLGDVELDPVIRFVAKRDCWIQMSMLPDGFFHSVASTVPDSPSPSQLCAALDSLNFLDRTQYLRFKASES